MALDPTGESKNVLAGLVCHWHLFFVRGLTNATKSADLYEPFARFGKVIDAVVIWHKDTNKSKGLGFAEFADAAKVLWAVKCKSSQQDSSMITAITESTC